MSGPIPLTVLTGFLGAGKTTLLNALLRHPDMADTAVLINEFGEVGLDHLLVERLDGDTVLLNAGCLCCTVRGDLLRALDDFWLRVQAGQSVRRVVVETTGLADPAPILQTLMASPMLHLRFALDGVVTLVDAMVGEATLDMQPEAVRQAAVADRLVLTKTDLAAPDSVAALAARLRALNPVAPILRLPVAPAALFDAGPFAVADKAPDVAGWIAAAAPQGDHHHHHHDPNRHDARIQALCLRYATPLPWDGVATWLEMLAATRGAAVLRMKGLLDLVGEEAPVVVHGVQHLFHAPRRLAGWPPGLPRESHLVFVLRDLDPAVVRQGLDAFVAAARGEAAIGAN
jgi:G3E family GTPase